MRRISFFILFVLFLGAVACIPKDPENETEVESLSFSQPSVTLELGETVTLTLVVTPTNAVVKNVVWTSSNPDVVTVSEGKITAVREGDAIITAQAGAKKAECNVTVKDSASEKIKTALMKIYNAMDGPNWNLDESHRWDMSKSLIDWQGVEWKNNELRLLFSSQFGFHLKGELPDCFEDLTECVDFTLQQQEGVTGTLPQSFSKLKNLKILTIESTSMTSLPDVFDGMPLGIVTINNNPFMTGPVPESLGKSDYMASNETIGDENCLLTISSNGFTGTIPQSWLKLGKKVNIQHHRFSSQIPDYFYTADNSGYWINTYINNGDPLDDGEYRKSHPFSVQDLDIPGYWPDRDIKDVMTGATIPYKEIISKNKATVIYRWSSWCNYSGALLPKLRKMYQKYHEAGLEVIARPAWGDTDGINMQKSYITDNGYDIWRNFSSDDISMTEEGALGSNQMPFVNIVDNKGNIIFSTSKNVSDPSRGRFGHIPYEDLIPFLEDIFGPLDDELYESTDYSRDGEVVALQKASVGKGINLVFMGDAYTDRDIASGEYDSYMSQSVEEFFNIEPYKSFRNRFNVYVVRVVSRHGRTGDGYSTALGTHATVNSITTGDIDKVYEYALKVPEITGKDNLAIGVMVNSSSMRGITDMSETLQSGIAFYSSVNNLRDYFGPLVRHEMGGHAFAFLADEYSTNNASLSQSEIDDYNRVYNKYGWAANIDFTDNPNEVKWSAFLSDERYKDEVGIYEGASGVTKGVFRPSPNSMMNQNQEYFNAPSRWAIYKRIMEQSGETASFDKFLEYDSVNRK